ncbi:MAG: ABC transporter substrate-binding protein [bacterium]
MKRGKTIAALAVCGLLILAVGILPAFAQKTTISLLWRANPTENKAGRATIEAFEKKYPNIKVEYIVVTWEEYEPKLTAMFAAGTPPDLFSCVGAGGIAKYTNLGMAMNLDPYIKRDNFDLDQFYPAALESMVYKGNQVGIPLGGCPSISYYNVDAFNEAGLAPIPSDWEDQSWTWDKMVEYAKKLTKTEGGRITQFGVDSGLWPATAYAWLWGGDWFTKEDYQTGTPKKVTLGPAVVEGFQRRADLMWKYHVTLQPAESQAISALGNPFKTGKVAMGFTGGWFFADFAPIKAFKWSIGALPKGTQRKGTLFSDPWVIANGSKHPEEAWTWIKFATSEEGQKIFNEGYVADTLNKKLLYLLNKKAPNVPENVLRETIMGGIKYSQESPNHTIVRWPEIENIVNAELDPLWLGKISAKEAVASLEAKLNKILAE